MKDEVIRTEIMLSLGQMVMAREGNKWAGKDLEGKAIFIGDFLNSLEACHEFEQHLVNLDKTEPLPQHSRVLYYLAQLTRLTGCLRACVPNYTPPQACEAYLRTLGRWVDPGDMERIFRSNFLEKFGNIKWKG